MRLAKQFNNIIEKQLNIFAAWLPVTNSYRLGDYGIIEDGVFAKMGNIHEFDVTITEGAGPETSIDFTSAQTRVTNIAAGVEVNVIPEGAVNAQVKFHFDNASSFVLKSPSISVATIDNINQVGDQLIAHPKWKKKFKVVYQIYFGKEVVLMSTINAGTEITFKGDVNALQKLKLGNVDVTYSSNSKLGLELKGAAGVIGLGLFQISTGFLGTGTPTVEILDDASTELKINYLSPANFDDDF